MQIIYWVHYLYLLFSIIDRLLPLYAYLPIAIILMIILIKGYAFLINIVLLCKDKSAKPPSQVGFISFSFKVKSS